MSRLRKGANEVAAVLRDAGYEVYFAGGCVRDSLLGHQAKDFDIVTNARPDEVDGLFKRTVLVGAAFGVVRVLWKHETEYEIASYRSDGVYSDGRRPDEVQYSQLPSEDVERRDFTINALLMNPETDEILDFVNGRVDLEAGLIRAVGQAERRFQEDRLRILRAVRFASRFGFEIEENTRKAMADHAVNITDVSEERIVMELHGIWTSSRPEQGMRLMADIGLLAALFEFLPANQYEELSRRHRQLSMMQSPLNLDARCALGWSVLLDLSEKIQPEPVLRRFKLSRNLMGLVTRILSQKHKLTGIEKLSQADQVRIVRDDNFEVFMGFLDAVGFEDESRSRAWRIVQDELEQSPLPQLPLLTGGDLSDLGFTPGPLFKKILRAVEDEVYERRLMTKDQALTWVKAQDWG